MSKIIFAAIIFALLLFLHFQHIEKYFVKIDKSIEANNLLLMQVSDAKKNNNEDRLAKINLNIEAFQGIDCARCHITQESLLLPLNRYNKISQEQFINIVRNGIIKDNKEIMPSYDTSQITDNALRIQYRIISRFYNQN